MTATITPVDLAARLQAGEQFTLIDVRELDEVAHGMIAGAVNVPLSQLMSGVQPLPELDKQTPVVAICRSGARSGMFAGELAGRGYDTLNLTGGMLAWVAAGLPIENKE